ncbi:MAG: protein TonB [Cryomorphaceae bacterium]|jgi:protein TonB
MNENQDLLSVTAFFSALAHAVIILGISFKLPDIADRSNIDNTLDVVLLNVSNKEEPQQADTISTSNNAGGGEDEKEATSPVPFEAVNPSPIDSILLVAEQQPVSTLTPDQLITAESGDIAVARLAPDHTKLKAQDKLIGNDILTTKSLRQLERERLIAKIAQTQEDYNKRPNKKFLSPTTKEHGAAKYLDQWSKSVTRNGNANFPVQVKANKLSGMLIVTVEINPNGTIADLKILSPSPHKLLNDSALRIIRNASPFAAFPDDDYFAGTDILVVTRSIHFLSNNQIISTAAPR